MFYFSRLTSYLSRLTSSLPKPDSSLILTACLTLFIMQSLQQPGLPAAADIPIHLYRTMEYQQAWSPGVIIPRWSPNLAFGYGYPLFIFAPPLPYLLGLAFHTVGLTFETSLKAVLMLTVLLYAIGMYLLARDLLNSVQAGLISAVAYVYAPFALRESLLYGGNIPQFLAIGLFPWTLWAMTRANRTKNKNLSWIILSAFFYANIILSHLFHALIFTPAIIGFLIFGFSINPKSKIAFLPLGLLLTAFFWLPAFMERYFTRAQTDIYLQKSPFFIRYPHWTELVAWIYPLDARAANPYVPLTLGVVTLSLAMLGVGGQILRLGGQKVGFFKKNSSPFPYTFTAYFLLLTTAAIFMSLSVSRSVWETITILQVAEFPWRMLGLANLGLAFLAGTVVLLIPLRFRTLFTAICLTLQISSVAPYLYPVTPNEQYGHITIADQINYERRSQSIGTTTLGEYLPETVKQIPTGSPMVNLFQHGQIPERLDRTSLPTGTTAALLNQDAVTHHYRLSSPTNFTLRMLHFDYLGWQATLDGQPLDIIPESKTGLMLLQIPSGQHDLLIHFGETALRIIAMMLSGITAVGLIIVWAWKHVVCVGQTKVYPTSLPTRRRAGWVSLGASFSLYFLFLLIMLWLKPMLRPIFTLDSPRGQALSAQHQTNIKFEKGIRLIGYDLLPAVVSAGDYLQIVLYWQADQTPIKANLQPFVHLDRLNDFITVAETTNYTPGDVTTESVLPTFHWDNSRYVRDKQMLRLPANLLPIAYAVRIGLIDPDQQRLVALADGNGDTAQLTIINVTANSIFPQKVRLAHPMTVSFQHDEDVIKLTSFEIDPLTPTRLDFSLVWQCDQTPHANYTIFAQLLDSNHRLVASFDAPPLDGAYPTSTWLADQSILDPRHIPLTNLPAGDYQLIIGLYQPNIGERLLTNIGQDFVELTTVSVK